MEQTVGRPYPRRNRSSKPSWISNEKHLQVDGQRYAGSAMLCPPAPVSLFDGLSVAVSLALLPELAAAAAAGFAAVAAIQGAAGLAHLAAIVQGGT